MWVISFLLMIFVILGVCFSVVIFTFGVYLLFLWISDWYFVACLVLSIRYFNADFYLVLLFLIRIVYRYGLNVM